MLRLRIVAALLAVHAAMPVGARAVVDAPDLSLLERETALKREIENKIQSDILDPILGKDRAKVFMDIQLEVMAQQRENQRTGAGMAERYKEKLGPNPGASFPMQFILPGVPKPKNVNNAPTPKPEASQGQVASQEKADKEEIFSLQTTVKRLLVTVIHDDSLPQPKLEMVRQRIIDALTQFKLGKDQIVFRPTNFKTAVWLDDLKNPSVYIPLLYALLLLLLLLFLFGPLAGFMRRYVEAIREKPAAEVNVESQIEQPEEEGRGLGGPEKSELDIMLGRKPTEPPPPSEEDEAMKKFEPFAYINEENLKRLANLFMLRREEPWLIAVVLSYLKPEFARQVLTQLPVELQAKVALEALKVRQVTREQVVAIDADVKESIDFVVGGMERLTQMLEESDTQTRKNILEYLKNEKPMVYERVRKFILTFEDVVGFPDREMQAIVRELKTDAMARALQGASPEVVNKFLSNMSGGAASLLKESMEYSKGLTEAQVEEERSKIIDTIKTMEKEGKIAIREGRGQLEGFQEELAIERVERLGARAQAKAALPAPAPAAASDPAAAQQFLQAGAQAHDAGRFEEAMAQLRQALDLDPNLWQAYQYLGNALLQTGRATEALGCYEKLLEINPDPQLRSWVESFKAQLKTAS